MTADSIPLDRPLPAELLRRVSGGLAAYQSYPVFSWAWLRRRTLLAALTVSCVGTLIALVFWLTSRQPMSALLVWAHFVFGLLAIATCGPALATFVRHRRLRLETERKCVIFALLFGVGASFLADHWASKVIEAQLALASLPAVPRPPDPQGWLTALNLLVLALIYGLLGGGLALRRYLSEPARMAELARELELSKLRERQRELDTRLGMLQAQIEPHFLFNTLASVSALIPSEPARAATTIDALVNYLRATIPKLRAETIESTLGQQLEICDSYLSLMRARMGRLEYDLRIDPSLGLVPFPPLLLLSLLENAIKHGLEPKPGPGRIVLEARQETGRLLLSVSDDGVGLREDGLGSGVGLRNVREQLRARYGDSASLTLTGVPSGGAVAAISIRTELRPA